MKSNTQLTSGYGMPMSRQKYQFKIYRVLINMCKINIEKT